MSDTQNEKEDTRQWFLRIGGETVFGPVSTQGLIVWAEQGRILPGHEVSTDRKKWLQSVSVDLLGMRWFVDGGDGEMRGPLNRLAAEALIKSGKVPAGAQLVSADDVEQEAASEGEAKQADKTAHDPVPEEVLRVRIRELESMVSSQRERLAKLANADALETVQHERDVLASLVKEVETQRAIILRNVEKDTRAHERKQELLRQQTKKLEQQLEEANNRLLMVDEAAAARPEQVDKTEAEQQVEQARSEGAEQAASLKREIKGLKDKLTLAGQALAEARVASENDRASLVSENATLAKRVFELEQALQFHERRAEETAEIVASREAELVAAHERWEACERRVGQADAATRLSEGKVRESEATLAELLVDANTRDNGYIEKIAALEKACVQTPDETARFFADQAAVYELVKDEVDELSKTLDSERVHGEQLKAWSMQRQQALVKRRQTLIQLLGSSPGEMTRRAVREQPSDPNAARLRTELDNLRIVQQRELRQAEERERDMQRKLRVFEAEASKLQGQAIEGDKKGRRMQELSDLLRRREQELADERKNRDAEREQFQGSQQALLMRIETLEKAAKPTTPDEIQMSEARNVKLASWMRLKK
ncbi:MAG: hypothetical protein WCK89_04755 [bacterium]